MPSSMTTFFTSDLYGYHGAPPEEYMPPDPLIVRVPVEESNTYVTLCPQDPLSSDAASDPSEHSDMTAYAETDTITRTANKVNFQFILRPPENRSPIPTVSMRTI